MSRLDIIAYNDTAVLEPIRQQYYDWVRAEKNVGFHIDSFPNLTLPSGKETEALRAILVEARLAQKLSFRFWWAGHNGAGKVGLFLSFKDDADYDAFENICDTHGALEPIQP